MNPGLLYREGTVEGASPTALITRLYEQTIEDLRQAAKALEQGDVELRSSRINHALLIVALLESQLDFEAGGKVAEHLRDFYQSLRANLIQAQLQQSGILLAQLITDLLTVREAWIEVERAEKSTPGSTHPSPSSFQESVSNSIRRDWNG
jgi:flagellar biosynthetic protein FliS